MNKQLQTLLSKEVSRKEFLALTGTGVIAVLGFSRVLELLQAKSRTQGLDGYGARSFGR